MPLLNAAAGSPKPPENAEGESEDLMNEELNIEKKIVEDMKSYLKEMIDSTKKLLEGAEYDTTKNWLEGLITGYEQALNHLTTIEELYRWEPAD